MLKLKIPEIIVKEIILQARAEAPIEACGILAGRDCEVTEIYKMTNADNSPEHFIMLPQEQFQVVKKIRAAGLEMLAIYHSHPETPARPSKEDVRLALTQDVIYIIVSLMDESNSVVKGFVIDNEVITEISVEII